MSIIQDVLPFYSGLMSWWPPKLPESVLDFTLDITGNIDPTVDFVSQATCAVSPWGAGEMQASNLQIVAGQFIDFHEDEVDPQRNVSLTVTLTGGQPGRTYKTKFIITMTDGRVFEVIQYLLIPRIDRAYPIPPAPNVGFSAPINAYGASLEEDTAATDFLATGHLSSASIVEIANATDFVTNSSVDDFEFANATAVVTAVTHFNENMVEVANATDTTAAAGGTLTSSVVETAGATDTLTVTYQANTSVTEIAAATDVVSLGAQLLASVVETAAAIDTIAATGQFRAILVEMAAAGVPTNLTLEDGSGFWTFADGSIISWDSPDVFTVASVLSASVTETVTATTLASLGVQYAASITENANATTVASTTGAAFTATITETSTATDNVGVSGATVIMTETATATDTLVVSSQLKSAVAETATATDAVDAVQATTGPLFLLLFSGF